MTISMISPLLLLKAINGSKAETVFLAFPFISWPATLVPIAFQNLLNLLPWELVVFISKQALGPCIIILRPYVIPRLTTRSNDIIIIIVIIIIIIIFIIMAFRQTPIFSPGDPKVYSVLPSSFKVWSMTAFNTCIPLPAGGRGGYPLPMLMVYFWYF